ncbi:flavonoid 3'-hydroxylase [Artemisia annua]|uniref:Flavonoid 3'-hydroxylase n=1 Tax=Artemisia annua TaxID=35608 RepID=A0A2U1Q1M7_ARTAN|nr:flavonoid 3'-hydroxylase [Artemisia annua]
MGWTNERIKGFVILETRSKKSRTRFKRIPCLNNSSDKAAQFLKVHDVNFASRPPNSGTKHLAYDYHNLVFAPYGPRWRLLRKICTVHLFSAKAVDDFRHVRQEEVAILTRILVSAANSPVQLGQLLHRQNCDRSANEFRDMVLELMVLAGEFNLGDFIPALDRFDIQGITKKMKKLHVRFDSFLSKIVEEHKMGHGGLGHVDLLSTLVSLKDDADIEAGAKLTDTEIKALLLVYMLPLFN